MAEPAVQVQTEYETIYILRPDTAKETTESLAGRLAETVNARGRVTAIENWGRRKLAYEVARQKRGVYVYLKYVGEGTIVADVERVLRLQESVLKYHTVKLGLVAGAVEVNPEDVRFEHVEQLEDEEDESLADELGLTAPRRFVDRSDNDSDDDDSDSDESDGEESEE